MFLTLGEHHNPVSPHWELERSLIQTLVTPHRKVHVEQGGSAARGLGWDFGGSAHSLCGLGVLLDLVRGINALLSVAAGKTDEGVSVWH